MGWNFNFTELVTFLSIDLIDKCCDLFWVLDSVYDWVYQCFGALEVGFRLAVFFDKSACIRRYMTPHGLEIN